MSLHPQHPIPFRQGLSDRQAAEAVRARIDWKYLLGLELSEPQEVQEASSSPKAKRLKGPSGRWRRTLSATMLPDQLE